MIRHEQENLVHPIVCCGNTGVHKLYQVLVTIQVWLREQKAQFRKEDSFIQLTITLVKILKFNMHQRTNILNSGIQFIRGKHVPSLTDFTKLSWKKNIKKEPQKMVFTFVGRNQISVSAYLMPSTKWRERKVDNSISNGINTKNRKRFILPRQPRIYLDTIQPL